jgi:hypothetical protein
MSPDARDDGRPGTSGELLPEVYDELRKLARARLARERHANQTLQPTALVHEAFLRVPRDRQWDRRGHFFAAAALAMRRILVERARHYQRISGGGGGAQGQRGTGRTDTGSLARRTSSGTTSPARAIWDRYRARGAKGERTCG